MANNPDTKLIQLLASSQPLIVNKALQQISEQYQFAVIQQWKNGYLYPKEINQIFDWSLSALVTIVRQGKFNHTNACIKTFLIKHGQSKIWTVLEKRMTDQLLIKIIEEGHKLLENKAFTYVMKQYKQPIIKILQRKSSRLEDAEDIFNESLIALRDNIKKGLLNKKNSAIKSYLISICKKKAWTKDKKKMVVEDLESIEVQHQESTWLPVTSIMEKEKVERLQQLINKLGEKCQEIILRSYWYQQTSKDIAKDLNMASGEVVRNKKSKCMKKLRELLGFNPSPFLDD